MVAWTCSLSQDVPSSNSARTRILQDPKAKLGSMQRAERLRDFWKSLGLSDFKYFGGLFLIPNLLNAGPFLLAAVLSSICGRMPTTATASKVA